MKKLIIGFMLITSTLATARTSVMVHKDCRIKNNTITILNSDGDLAKNSPESILIRKGYQVGASTEPNDTLSDLMQLNYSQFTSEGQILIELVSESNDSYEVFVRAGKDVSEAVEKLPACQTY